MKKSKKGFILLGITTSIIAANGIIQTIKPLKTNIEEKRILGYNHNPATALDNVFKEDGMTILPFIFEAPTDKLTESRIREEFAKAGLTIKSISTGTTVGTGTEITVNENSNIYTVLVYGDVNGDGEVDIYDAMRIIRAVKQSSAALNGIYFKAGNVANDDNIIDIYDAMREISFMKRIQKKLVIVEPASLKETRELTSITAEYNNSVAVSAATTLDQIKPNIVVKAHYNNGDVETVTTFDLKGNLIAGQDNSLTVTVAGKTANITVTVAERELVSISAKYDDTTPVPVTTTLEELKAKVSVTGTYNNNTTAPITEFTLDGILAPGTSNIIKVKTQGKEATITVTVEEDSVTGITLKTLPKKTKYNYGEETLDLTGGEITVNYLVGGQKTESITSGMVSGYNPKQEGPQTITVTYSGVTTTFEVTVLDRISALEVKESGRTSNVTVVSGGYKVDSKAEFVLGTIQAANKDNVSALNPDMLTFNVELNSSEDADATKDSLTVEKVVDKDGNVTLKGTAAKAGTYTINVVLSYEDKTVTLPITVQAVKSLEIKRVNLTMDKDDLKVGKPLRINIEVININDEKITPDSIEFINENPAGGLAFTMYDSTGALIDGTDLSEVAYIEVSTTIETAQTATFTVKATTAKNSKTTDATLQVKDAPVVTSIQLSQSNIPLYIEDREGTTTDENGNIYTVLDVEFFDQVGEKMEVEASNILMVSEDAYNPINLKMTKSQIALIRPIVDLYGMGMSIPGNGLYTKLYDEDGKEATGHTTVSKIGVALITDSADFEVVLSSIVGKNLKFGNNVGATIGAEIPLQVVYKDLTTIRITEEGQENVTKDGSMYNVPLNQEFILGTITVGPNEGPLTPDMLTIETPKDGITISYELKDGKIIVKGTITIAGTYSVRPITTDGKVLAKNSMNVKAEAIPNVKNITISKSNVEIGRATEAELTVETDLNPTGEPITAGDIKVEYDSDIKVTLLNEDRDPIEDGQLLQKVKYLKLEAKELTQTDNDNVNLKITVFEGKTNVKSVSNKISVYQPVPRVIETDATATLYGAANANTVTADDGLIYTLVPVSAWADAEKTKPVVLTCEMFNQMSADKKVSITIPTVKVRLEEHDLDLDEKMITTKFFDENNHEISNGDIVYIGLAICNLPDPDATFDRTQLNGLEITLTCVDNSAETKITTSYSEN